MEPNERIGVMEARMNAHFDADELGFARLTGDTTEIKAMITGLARDVKEATQRLHERLDEEASKARHALNNATMAAQIEIKSVASEARSNTNLALAAAQKASDDVKENKIWTLSTAVGAAGGLILWLFQLIWGKNG